MLPKIALNQKAYQKIASHAPWLYANEVKSSPRKNGDVYLTYRDEIVATAFYNPLSTIAYRVVCYEQCDDIAKHIEKQITHALALRKGWIAQGLIDSNAYRLIHSEADQLPGLIVDRYDDVVVCAFTSAGMERYKSTVIKTLDRLVNPSCIYEKSDSVRQKEGLAIQDQLHKGCLPAALYVREHDLIYRIDTKHMHKTGFYLDQRFSRQKLRRYKPQRVLDLFAHSGAFGIALNAPYTCFVEISKHACAQADHNAQENRLKSYDIVCEDVFAFLQTHTKHYDLIIIDPPPFAKSKQQKPGALRGWRYLISQSAKLLQEGGMMALFSCSHAINEDDLLELVKHISIKQNWRALLIEQFWQDIDHPIAPSVFASKYLSGILIQKVTP